MENAKVLKEKFDRLYVSKNNLLLWRELLRLDQSIFKPLMDEILKGTLDIEDTRVLFRTNRIYHTYSDKSKSGKHDRLISDDLENIPISNIKQKLFPKRNQEIIKEVPADILNLPDYRKQIADEYKKRTGKELSEEQISKILPEVERRVLMQTNYNNIDFPNKKEMQIKFNNAILGGLNSKV